MVAVRRGGAIHAFDTINHFFTISQMVVPGSSYWNVGIGREIGDVEGDEEGITTMKVLGQNMAWLLKKLLWMITWPVPGGSQPHSAGHRTTRSTARCTLFRTRPAPSSSHQSNRNRVVPTPIVST